ncbi:MAG: stage III sporulation protein AA [Clostridiales bacterium]|nr:stage III sporulation protein AA [Clostridiales bacterium]
MQQIIRLFPLHMRSQLEHSGIFRLRPEEIRVRVNEYLIFRTSRGELFLRGDELVSTPDKTCCRMRREDVEQMCTFMSNYSLYAYEEEIRRGFLTVEGGHRVGVCGQVSVENGQIRRISPISYLNIRIAGEHKGCAAGIFPFLHRNGDLCNTLILSKPGAGKTTMLRDLVRSISCGRENFPGKKVGLVDERSEIAGCIRGVPQNDVGLRTDVLDRCPKEAGMMLLVRSMSPEVVAVDEIGGTADLAALAYVLRCGCRVIATVHCRDMEELWKKPGWGEVRRGRMFERFVVLDCRGGERIYRVFDETGETLTPASGSGAAPGQDGR